MCHKKNILIEKYEQKIKRNLLGIQFMTSYTYIFKVLFCNVFNFSTILCVTQLY